MTKDDHLIEFLSQLQCCGDYESSWRLFTQTVSKFGFIQTTYGFFPDTSSDDGSEIILTNYNADFVSEYIELGGIQSDDTVQWSQATNDVCHWRNPEHRSLHKNKYLPLEELSQDFNILNGVTIQMKTRHSRSNSFIGLSATDSNQHEYERDVMPHLKLAVAMTHILELHLNQFEPHQMLAGSVHSTIQALNPLEQEAIRWLSNGYSIKEIADKKLFKSVESINLYIKKAKQKLQVRNRDQLIARAVLLGLV